MAGRPRTPVGTFGVINVRRRAGRVVAEVRIRDVDGRLRRVTATANSAAAARRKLQERLRVRPSYGVGHLLSRDSSFGALVALWLTDLELQKLADGTKERYRDQIRLHVAPAFEHFTLAEITTGRVEWFLKSQAITSPTLARKSRTMLNLLFAFALRHDAITRNPVEGTSSLAGTKSTPQALTMSQVTAIRSAAARWRMEPGRPGPRPDGQVRDIIEVLLGTAMRVGEVLGLRICDVADSPTGMLIHVRGTVVQHKGKGVHRQERPKTDASIRRVMVPEFAAEVLRRRLADVDGVDPERTIFASRAGTPLSPYNVRRTFREFLDLAGLGDTGITLRWYRRTAATVIARAMNSDAAATYLGHTSSVITEGHYIEPDLTVDLAPAQHLERTLRITAPDARLLVSRPSEDEDQLMDELDGEDGDVD